MSLITSLQLSYDELPTHLKPCLLSFSIYPEDYGIDVDILISWWEGEGFVRGKNGETAREVGFNCLSELISRCFVDVYSTRSLFDERPDTCTIHDMVRDLTIKIARDENFSSFDTNGKHIANSSSRRLGVGEDTRFQDLQGNSKLRALLFLTGNHDVVDFSKNIELAKVHSLRVLDFSMVNLDNINVKDLWKWICSLKRLAYLNLALVEHLCEVPSSIEKLWGLQKLILARCRNLDKLPSSIVKLPRLICLNVANCPRLKCIILQGFSRLFSLQELYGFRFGGKPNSTGSYSGSALGELENLTELRALSIAITKESRIQDYELQVLANLHKLKMLSIDAGNRVGSQDNDILMQLGKLSPPPSVEELFLVCYAGDTLPEWISPNKLKKLQYFSINDSRVKKMSKELLGHGDCEIGDENRKWDVEGLCLSVCPGLELSGRRCNMLCLRSKVWKLYDALRCRVFLVRFRIGDAGEENTKTVD